MSELSKTAILLEKIVAGDESAKNDLVAHCYPLLLKWAHGRIPYSEISLVETTDLVQDTLIKGLQKIDRFKSHRTGAFLAYLRQIFINNIRDTANKAKPTSDIDDFLNSKTHFSHEVALNDFISYEQALQKLNDIDQEAIILRIEFGFSYEEIAEAMEKSSADAARMLVNRALVKITKFIQ